MVFQMVFQFFNGAEDFDLESLLYRTDCYNPRTKNKSKTKVYHKKSF